MNTEIAVSRIHQVLQIAERQRLISGQRADDSETQTFMNQAIEIRRGTLLLRTGRLVDPRRSAFRFCRSFFFAVDCLATVFPRNNYSKHNV